MTILKSILEINSKPYFSTNSNTSTFSLFEARKNYYNISLPYIIEKTKNINNINITFGDLYNNNALYGLLDHNNDIVAPLEIYLKTFSLQKTDTSNDQKLQDFCYEAFAKMKEYLEYEVLCGKLNPESIYANLNIFKCYNDPLEVYFTRHTDLQNIFKQLVLSFKEINSKIVDHKTFINEYTKFIKIKTINEPITFSQNITYFNFTFFTSGIMFSISKNDDPANDILKYDKFFTDDGFGVFAEACKRFGFKIDKNIPWILYADIASPAMISNEANPISYGFLSKKGITSIEDFFNKRFIKTYKLDLSLLKEIFYNAYEAFLSDGNEYYQESESDLCLKEQKIYQRKKVTKEQFFKDFPDIFWCRIYAYIRNYETRRNLTQVEFDNIVREANNYIKYNKMNDAMKYLNDYFKEYKNVAYFSTLLPAEPRLESAGGNYINEIKI